MKDTKSMKPKSLTLGVLIDGGLPGWLDNYADWLASLPSFQNGTERARYGRIRALRSLRATLDKATAGLGWTDEQVTRLVMDTRDMAKLRANHPDTL